ncbi:hypothetical protein VFPPC_17428 [Pochonia chlamydosporia 170]|uniref:Uncharacterized protein n=1 Tax=Pochonia chlamydosporia 170 TaxID=1380566 RepID=A0A219ARM9_METCM|nr:hypothetical protein VFPPC_17428 [Pochonia chlamydosporia 170]OWT43423.1 hypothetical protein VFPPC_17428 [Pochonia chlamydosporia 170]
MGIGDVMIGRMVVGARFNRWCVLDYPVGGKREFARKVTFDSRTVLRFAVAMVMLVHTVCPSPDTGPVRCKSAPSNLANLVDSLLNCRV